MDMSNEQHPNPWSREAWSTSGTPRESAPQQQWAAQGDAAHQPQQATPPQQQATQQQPSQASASINEPTLNLTSQQGYPTSGPDAQQGYPTSNPGYQPVGPFGQPQATAGTQTKTRSKGRNKVAGVLALALLAVGAGGGAGYAATQIGGSTSASGVTTTVVQADASNPNWTTVAEAATQSVVAIDVTSSSGEAQGSGVVIDADGYIVTNNHVVSGMSGATITVLLNNVSYAATIVGTDPSTDLAVIKIDNPPQDLAVMSYGDNTALSVGDPVMAIGNPLGLSDTVTTGIVSALNRPVTTEAVTDDTTTESQTQVPQNGNNPFGGQQQEQQNQSATTSTSETVVTAAIQTNAAINPGNSGGALVNASGELVGITSSIATLSSSSSSESSSGNIGIGFAIGSDQVKYVVDQLIANGTAEHPQLGVTATDVTGTGQQGAQIVSVTEGSGAAEAGLEAGDVVTAVNGNAVSSTESLIALVRAGQVGKPMTLTVIRNGTEQDVSVTPTAAAN